MVKHLAFMDFEPTGAERSFSGHRSLVQEDPKLRMNKSCIRQLNRGVLGYPCGFVKKRVLDPMVINRASGLGTSRCPDPPSHVARGGETTLI